MFKSLTNNLVDSLLESCSVGIKKHLKSEEISENCINSIVDLAKQHVKEQITGCSLDRKIDLLSLESQKLENRLDNIFKNNVK